ncbi:MAG TPA: hypothetical protein VFQ61_35275 [Polyangiaceae bacterium]|nr:hypothetical protein [Polyangiaceae bacterium]
MSSRNKTALHCLSCDATLPNYRPNPAQQPVALQAGAAPTGVPLAKPWLPRMGHAGLFCTLLLAMASAAHAETTPRAQAEATVRELEGSQGKDRALTEPLLVRARSALTRAKNARQAGDQRHGSLLEALAMELAESARDLVRVKSAEQQTTEFEKQALDAETRAVRARALVELAAARRGRAQEQLDEAEAARRTNAKADGAASNKSEGKPPVTPRLTAPRPAETPKPTQTDKPLQPKPTQAPAGQPAGVRGQP